MLSARRSVLASAAAIAMTVLPAIANGEPCGWAHFGSGVMGWRQGEDADFVATPTLAIDLGLGADPEWPVFVGGLMRLQPYVGYGTDLAWLARLALGGFQGDWLGLAVDAGLAERFWGDGSNAFLGDVVLAGPFGLQLTAVAQVGDNDALGFGGTLGIDFARLTVGRGHLLEWWPNPQPEQAIDDPRVSLR